MAPQQGGCHNVLEHLLLKGNNKDNFINKTKEEGGEVSPHSSTTGRLSLCTGTPPPQRKQQRQFY
jgi:hypothetical protein